MKQRSDTGQGLVEAIMLSLLFIVPILWALGVLSDLHRGALAATAAAREAGFEAARSTSASDASASAEGAVARAFEDHGLDADVAELTISLSGLERAGTVEVHVRYPVTVFQAPLLGRVTGPSVWIAASHTALIDPYRSRE